MWAAIIMKTALKQRGEVRGRNLVFREVSLLPHCPIVTAFLYSPFLSRAELCLKHTINSFPTFVNILIEIGNALRSIIALFRNL
jgi:hypothetical protein